MQILKLIKNYQINYQISIIKWLLIAHDYYMARLLQKILTCKNIIIILIKSTKVARRLTDFHHIIKPAVNIIATSRSINGHPQGNARAITESSRYTYTLHVRLPTLAEDTPYSSIGYPQLLLLVLCLLVSACVRLYLRLYLLAASYYRLRIKTKHYKLENETNI